MWFLTHFLLLLSDPFNCGAAIGCGGDGWLISDPSLLSFVANATCSDSAATPFPSLTALNCQCPELSIAPCTCQPSEGSSTSLTISCANLGKDNAAIETVVANTPATTPVDTFDLSGNILTSISADLPQYKTLIRVSFANNSITSIGSTDLSLTGNVLLIDVSYNQISNIAAGSLPGKIIFTETEFLFGCFLVERI